MNLMLILVIASGNEEYSKQELEKLAIENGAECVQNADASDIVIAGSTSKRSITKEREPTE